jgi:hypothetical protein
MEQNKEKPDAESIPPTDFKPLKKPKVFVSKKTVIKKKYLDNFFSDEWKNKLWNGG